MHNHIKYTAATLLTAACLVTILAGCLKPPTIDPVAAQIAEGRPIYARDCATELCHGTSGEGLPSADGFRVWPLLGAEFEARNPNAQVIFDVVRSGGEANLRALSDTQLYAAIAYELAQNGVELSEPLNETNAAGVRSGANSPNAAWGSLFPPPGNARLLDPPSAPPAAPQAANDQIVWRVSQLALAGVIGRSVAPQDGAFVIMVFAVQNVGKMDITVDPKFLRLIDTNGYAHLAAQANLAFPMERFHPTTIRPGYGVAGYEIFAIPPGADADRLIYNHPDGLILDIHLQ